MNAGMMGLSPIHPSALNLNVSPPIIFRCAQGHPVIEQPSSCFCIVACPVIIFLTDAAEMIFAFRTYGVSMQVEGVPTACIYAIMSGQDLFGQEVHD